MNESYNGWKNYETWNVALWFANDEGLYDLALTCETYADYVLGLGFDGVDETPDGVSLNDAKLDTRALDEAIVELRTD